MIYEFCRFSSSTGKEKCRNAHCLLQRVDFARIEHIESHTCEELTLDYRRKKVALCLLHHMHM